MSYWSQQDRDPSVQRSSVLCAYACARACMCVRVLSEPETVRPYVREYV